MEKFIEFSNGIYNINEILSIEKLIDYDNKSNKKYELFLTLTNGKTKSEYFNQKNISEKRFLDIKEIL